MVMIGASMLWVGWFGFNAGSQGAANAAAGMTMLVTHISAAVASLTAFGLLAWGVTVLIAGPPRADRPTGGT
jgi:ammonia channel protein AmtB